MPEYQVDPELQSEIPPLAASEYTGLEEDIRATGRVLMPLTVWQYNEDLIVVDGHNRLEIATKHQLPMPEPTYIEFEDKTEAKLWINRQQRNRRNLTDGQKFDCYQREQELLREQGRKRKVEGGDKGRETRWHLSLNDKSHNEAPTPEPTPAPIPEPEPEQSDPESEPHNTQQLLAESIGWSTGKVAQAEKVKREAPELWDKVRNGDATVGSAYKQTVAKTKKADREQKRKEAAEAAVIPDNLIVGDFRDHAGVIPDGSLSLIFTDPPYDRKASEILPELGKFAADKLCDGGSLLLYVGQTQLPTALESLTPHVRYWWVISCLHSGHATVMREYGINAKWKAVLWFVKGTRHDETVIVNDVMSGGEEKQHHNWQQAESEAAYWIDKLTTPDGIICDPFLGSGTTAVAAKSLNRRWVGFEIDEDTAGSAANRVKTHAYS